jgi:hypothetical protein
LKAYDALGNGIAILVNEEEGVYSEIVDASSLASGVLSCQLICGSSIETKHRAVLK